MKHPGLFVSLLLLPGLVSCQSPSGSIALAGRQDPAYEDSLYCFNGCYIVSRDGMKGLTDESGSLILPPTWDEIEFLDDEVALLRRGGVYYLCTRAGRLLAEGTDPMTLEGSFQERLSQVRLSDLESWDLVLDQLEALADACISSRHHRLDTRILEARSLLQERLSAASGTMVPEQLARLESIENKFYSLYR